MQFLATWIYGHSDCHNNTSFHMVCSICLMTTTMVSERHYNYRPFDSIWGKPYPLIINSNAHCLMLIYMTFHLIISKQLHYMLNMVKWKIIKIEISVCILVNYWLILLARSYFILHVSKSSFHILKQECINLCFRTYPFSNVTRLQFSKLATLSARAFKAFTFLFSFPILVSKIWQVYNE